MTEQNSFEMDSIEIAFIRNFQSDMSENQKVRTNPLWRLLRFPTIFFIGVLVKITIDVILNLKFRNYPLFENIFVYLGAGFIAWLIYQALKTVNNQLDYAFDWNSNPVRRFFVQALFDISLSIIIIMFFRFLIAYFNWGNHYVNVIEEFVNVLVVSIYTLIFVIGDLSYFLVNRWRVSLAELESFKKENLAFEFGMLKTQINPHFLFNSLNTLSGLVHTKPDMASEFIRQLSKLYRILLKEKDNVHNLEKELGLLDSYIYLVSLRFADNIKFEKEIEVDHLKLNIAPLTLQMLIENAIKHNIVSSKKPLNIKIKSLENNLLEISNNLQLKIDKEESTEIGLKNIKKRYEFLSSRPVNVIENDSEFKVIIPLL